MRKKIRKKLGANGYDEKAIEKILNLYDTH